MKHSGLIQNEKHFSSENMASVFSMNLRAGLKPEVIIRMNAAEPLEGIDLQMNGFLKEYVF